ncbi:MAG: hypothetical protein ACI4HN_07380 [Ruminococcus sp.]
MLYSLFRLVIVFPVCLVIYIIIKKINRKRNIKGLKSKHTKIYMCVISIAVVSILGTALYVCPFENLFIDFSSPEDVFKYTANGDIDKVIYGDNSCMIIYSDNNSQDVLFVGKDNDSFKIVTYPQYSKEHLFTKNYWSANIYTLNQTGDTYCAGQLINDVNNVNISDNLGTEYYCIKESDNVFCFYGYVKGYDEKYTINID